MGIFEDIIGVSAKEGKNIDVLIKSVVGFMDEGPMYFPDDMVTENPERFVVSEIIREKILMYMQDEIPHGVAVNIELFREEKDMTRISAVIYCEKRSHKGMIIGKGAELEKMEFFVQPNGSLFKLTKGEFDFIMDIIRDDNPLKQADASIQKYTKEDFLNKVYMTEERYDVLEALLRNKKNLILQGAPGVGKTFTAKKLAYAMMGAVDDSRIEMVQFHQNYSYEDFIMGYRPGTGVTLGYLMVSKLTHGIFAAAAAFLITLFVL